MSGRALIMGPPGSGKGTQAERICDRRGIAHISTGDMLREAMAAGTELGEQVKAVVDSGNLVGDDLMLALVDERLKQDDARAGFLLDGFPRTVPQADGLLGLVGGNGLHCVLLLQVDDEVLTKRLLGRGRTDDTAETIGHRLAVYREQTEPVLAFLGGRGLAIETIDGEGTVDEITDRIERVLDAEH